MTTNWNGYGGNFGGLNLCCIGPKAQTCDRSHHNRFRVLESEDIDDASDDAKPGDDSDKVTLAVNVERKVMPRKYTIGDAIQIAKTRVAKSSDPAELKDNASSMSLLQTRRTTHWSCLHVCFLNPRTHRLMQAPVFARTFMTSMRKSK